MHVSRLLRQSFEQMRRWMTDEMRVAIHPSG